MLPDHTLTSQLRDVSTKCFVWCYLFRGSNNWSQFMQVAYTMAPVGPEMLDYVDAVISSDLNRNLGM